MLTPLKVTHVVLSLDVGGMERMVLGLVRSGCRRGQAVTVVCLERRGTLAPEVEAAGATVMCLGKRPGLRLGFIWRLARLFGETRPDVVHTHQVGALFYAGPAARAAGVSAVVHTEHGKHYAGRRRTRWLGRLAGPFAGRFFCVSEDIAAEVRDRRVAAAGKVHVVPNGIDTTAFDAPAEKAAVRKSLGLPTSGPLVGTVGRLTEVKRQDLLLRAFAKVRERTPQARLVLVGDGPLGDELRRLAGELGLNDSVHFAGYQTRPEQYLLAMDVFVLTSRSEGMPLAVLEAWAAGVPVVASRVGGLLELVRHGENGLLFDFGDEAALTDRVCDLIAAEELARRMGESGRELVRERFGVEATVAEYQRHYQALSGKASATVRQTETAASSIEVCPHGPESKDCLCASSP